MKLTYWVAPCLDDSPVYSIRSKTKRACAVRRLVDEGTYGEPQKVTLEYRDAFDLLCLLMQEGGPSDVY